MKTFGNHQTVFSEYLVMLLQMGIKPTWIQRVFSSLLLNIFFKKKILPTEFSFVCFIFPCPALISYYHLQYKDIILFILLFFNPPPKKNPWNWLKSIAYILKSFLQIAQHHVVLREARWWTKNIWNLGRIKFKSQLCDLVTWRCLTLL